MHLLTVVLTALQLQFTIAVKSWMFKRCDQNPFCERNREYADSPNTSLYHVDSESIDVSNPIHITGNVLKRLDEEQEKLSSAATFNGHAILPFYLDIVTDSIIRLVIDEKDRVIDIEDVELGKLLNSERFSPADYVLDPDTKHLRVPKTATAVQKFDDHLEVNFGYSSNKVVLEFSPIKLTVSHRGEDQVVLNKKHSLNYDHLRRKRDGERNADWEDRFDKYTDYHVRGPESVALDTTFEGYQHLYGIPEHADSLDLQDTTGKEPYRLFNVDIFEYETQSRMPMYGSIPLITSQKPGHAVGVFWLNAADTYIDIAKGSEESSAHWISETGKLEVFVLLGDTPRDVLASYGMLTGTAELPQQFSIGYHQCRWNYQSQDELLGVNSKMDKFYFPYDAIWLDLEWSDDRRYFAWNTDKFPDSEKMMETLDETKRKLIVLNDPHIKAKEDYEVFTELRDNEVLIKDTSGKHDFHAHCWPGESSWIDSMNPASWPVWAKFHQLGTKLGGYAKNLHLWSDMSEPSVFSGSETTAYKGLIHHGGWQHRDLHNLYGHTVFNITYDALRARYSGLQRPFVLTRSFFSGSQKLGPTWTGDNQAEWEYLRAATPMILTLGVSGYPFAGADVGGFFRNPSDELLLRWYQSGAFYPFYRAHAHIESRYREPYLLDHQWRDLIRDAIELRYQLLPELYTQFWEANQQLQPIMRPLYYEYPSEPEIYSIEDQFFIGSSLMAKPITTEGANTISVVLPGKDIFYDYFTGEEVDGSEADVLQLTDVKLDTIPLFVRGGRVVFRKDRKRRSSELMVNDPYTLLIAVNRVGTAYGRLYVDDGITFNYETENDYLLTEVEYSEFGIKGSVVHSSESKFAQILIERIIVYGADTTKAEVTDSGEAVVVPIEHGFIIRKPNVKIGENWFIHLS